MFSYHLIYFFFQQALIHKIVFKAMWVSNLEDVLEKNNASCLLGKHFSTRVCKPSLGTSPVITKWHSGNYGNRGLLVWDLASTSWARSHQKEIRLEGGCCWKMAENCCSRTTSFSWNLLYLRERMHHQSGFFLTACNYCNLDK